MKITFEGTYLSIIEEMLVFADAQHTVALQQPIPEDTPEEKPKATKRKTKFTITKRTEMEAPVEEPAKKSRRKTGKPAAKPKADDGLSDADVAKAASLAAGIIEPKGVKKILEQFGVANVNKLEDDQRQEFIDLLKEATNAAS